MNLRYPDAWNRLQTVLSHDWLTGMRGGERCLELLCDGFPDAPLYALVHEPEKISDTINAHPVTTSILQAGITRKYFRAALPLLPTIVERFRPPSCDLVISTNHCVAKGIPVPEGAKHLCYCFTPMRYGIFYHDYFGESLLNELAVRPLLASLRRWDVRSSSRIDRFVAISEHVRRRIRYIYNRDADVVYPPVDTERYTPDSSPRETYDLAVSALVPYKRIDLAVRAYTTMNKPLHVVGTGGRFDALRREAGPSVEFLGWQTDEQILEQYRRCRFLLFPGEEDFGIVPLEAQACGTPVIAYGRGGALETIRHGETGWFFRRQAVADLIEAVEAAEGRAWDSAAIRANAERFHPQRFIDGLADSIDKCLNQSRL